MSLLDLIVLGSGVFYLSHVVTSTSGPLGIFSRLRQRYAISVLVCIKCLSMWVAIVACLVYYSPIQVAVYPFAVAGVALLVFRHTGGSHSS